MDRGWLPSNFGPPSSKKPVRVHSASRPGGRPVSPRWWFDGAAAAGEVTPSVAYRELSRAEQTHHERVGCPGWLSAATPEVEMGPFPSARWHVLTGGWSLTQVIARIAQQTCVVGQCVCACVRVFPGRAEPHARRACTVAAALVAGGPCRDPAAPAAHTACPWLLCASALYLPRADSWAGGRRRLNQMGGVGNALIVRSGSRSPPALLWPGLRCCRAPGQRAHTLCSPQAPAFSSSSLLGV